MSPCLCLQADNKSLQGFTVERNVRNRSQAPSAFQRSNSHSNYDIHGYERQCVDDYTCRCRGRPFTDIYPPNHVRSEACHQLWNTSHGATGIKRKRKKMVEIVMLLQTCQTTKCFRQKCITRVSGRITVLNNFKTTHRRLCPSVIRTTAQY